MADGRRALFDLVVKLGEVEHSEQQPVETEEGPLLLPGCCGLTGRRDGRVRLWWSVSLRSAGSTIWWLVRFGFSVYRRRDQPRDQRAARYGSDAATRASSAVLCDLRFDQGEQGRDGGRFR
jgi:hypothetical protein